MAMVRVFSQTALSAGGPVEHTLVARANALFEAELTFARRHFSGPNPTEAGGPSGDRRAALTGTFAPRASRRGAPVAGGERLTFELCTRPRTADDLAAAQVAEQRGRAGGMALLAARCDEVWEVSVVPAGGPEATETPAFWLLLALLASVSLGPVLPADGSTLLGVRSARERAERAAEPLPVVGVETSS
jgi:hypothetical protein